MRTFVERKLDVKAGSSGLLTNAEKEGVVVLENGGRDENKRTSEMTVAGSAEERI